MKKNVTVKMMISGLLLCSTGFADLILLKDTFNTVNTNDISYDLAGRQTGSLATKTWSSAATAGSNFATITNNALQIKNTRTSGTSTSAARLGTDFATVTNDVRIAVDVANLSTNGISNINFGMSSSDAITAITSGYSFRLDLNNDVLVFFDSNVQIASMAVVADVGTAYSLVVDYTGGNTISATFNGIAYDFGGGAESYTDTAGLETQNYVQVGWWGGVGSAATFDNLTITVIPEPVTVGLAGFAMFVVLLIRRIASV